MAHGGRLKALIKHQTSNKHSNAPSDQTKARRTHFDASINSLKSKTNKEANDRKYIF